MAYYIDNAFTFTSESDLLPIWYTAPDPFMLTSPFSNDYWDDPFGTGTSDFQTFTTENQTDFSYDGGYMAVVPPSTAYDPQPPPPAEAYGCESALFQDQVEGTNERDPNCMRDAQVVDEVHWERPIAPQVCFIGNEENDNNHLRRIENNNPFCENNNLSQVKDERIIDENFEKEDEEQNSGIYINDDKFPTYDINGGGSGSGSQEDSIDSPRGDDDPSDLVLLSGVDDPIDFKLPASKSPIMEAMVVCAIKNWGISIAKSTPSQVIFRVTDFDHYYKISRSICSKQHPTEDIGSRVKSLRRWFENFPKKKDRQDNPNFLLAVKPSGTKKVNEMIERNTRLLGVQKRRRRQ